MEESLRSFFLQDYPEYEIVFCVADTADPAIRLVIELMREYSRIPTRLHVGEAMAGANPKVCNLIPGYEIARHDLLLISDSNVRVWPTYLRQLAACVRPGVGVVTAVVAGREGRGLGGRLEAAYLNTCVTRWMWMAYALGYPCVIGKTMLFRRSVMDRFGGLRNLAKYVAEDFMAGLAMHRMGYRVEILKEPVGQFIGNYSFSSFWNRHLRWGRIRHSQSPPGFYIEPLNYAFGSGLLGAWAFWQAFGVSFFVFLGIHLAVWSVGDALLIRRMEGHLSVRSLLAWFLRELLALPHWLHMLSSNRIMWRGHRLKILNGGLVQS
jgi:ceramide glucosyltransferase